MIVECTYTEAHLYCIYLEDGSFGEDCWKKGDICLHHKPHEETVKCTNGAHAGKCSCESTFTCKMLTALKDMGR